MDSKHIERLLKPYDKHGFPRADYYSAYGMAGAVVITDKNNDDALEQLDAECVVAIDVCDFLHVGRMKKVRNLCLIYTRKHRKIKNVGALYSLDLQTLLFSDCSRNIEKIDLSRFGNLSCLKTRNDAVDLSRACSNLISIGLNDITGSIDLEFINGFRQLKDLSLEGGISELDGIDRANALENLTINNCEIANYSGLANLPNLKKLSLTGVFTADIIAEIARLRNLEYLRLDSYFEIDNVDFVKDLPNLKVIILGCVIRNGDTSPLVALRHARLKADSANYNFRDADLPKNPALVKSFE